jgi:long-chain acyl-CoA synthetase
VILPSWDARQWLGLVERHRVTRSFMVPAHFIRILEVPEPERKERDLSSLRLIVHGAAPCPIDVKRRIMEVFSPAPVWELYGMSEGGATRISPEDWLAKPGSVGTPWPGVQIRILDDEGNEQPTGSDGLIYILPPAGFGFEYHGDPAKTAQAWREQGFTVGDVGHLDDDGYLYVTDRAADMVIRGGVNIYPREVEEALHRHPAVVDCAVFGVPDERYGEHLVAVVEARQPVEPDELKLHCRSLLADFKCPEEVDVVGTLPRDPAGKVLKRRLKEQYV